jgi:hypothetical protein
VTAYCNHHAHHLNSEAAQNKCRPLRRGGKQENCPDGEKEAGWHHQQSCVFHGSVLSALPRISPVDKGRPRDICPQKKNHEWQKVNRLKRFYEF